MQKAFLDRIVDGQWAVLLVGEEETERVIPMCDLPSQAKAGQWLIVRFEEDRLVSLTIDEEETARRAARVGDKLARLRQRGRKRS